MRVLRETIRTSDNARGIILLAAEMEKRHIPSDAAIVITDLEEGYWNGMHTQRHGGRLEVTFEWPAPKTFEEQVHG